MLAIDGNIEYVVIHADHDDLKARLFSYLFFQCWLWMQNEWANWVNVMEQNREIEWQN